MTMAVRRRFVAGLALAWLLGGTAGAAHAQVVVSPSAAIAGTAATLTFRVSDERDSASTTSVEIAVPTGTALHAVSVLPKPGWDVTVNEGLPVQSAPAGATPVPSGPAGQGAGGSTAMPGMNMPGMDMSGMSMPGMNMSGTPASATPTADAVPDEAVQTITWRAQGATNAIASGQSQDFTFTATMPANRDSIAFAAVEKYNDGTTVRWIELTGPGLDPTHPAPVVTLAPNPAASSAVAPANAAQNPGGMAGMPMPGSYSGATSDKSGMTMSMPGMAMSGMSMSASASDTDNVVLAVVIAGLIAAFVAASLALTAFGRTRKRQTVGVSASSEG